MRPARKMAARCSYRSRATPEGRGGVFPRYLPLTSWFLPLLTSQRVWPSDHLPPDPLASGRL